MLQVIKVYRKNAVDDVTGIRFGVSNTLSAIAAPGQTLVPTSGQITNVNDCEMSSQKEGTGQMNTQSNCVLPRT